MMNKTSIQPVNLAALAHLLQTLNIIVTIPSAFLILCLSWFWKPRPRLRQVLQGTRYLRCLSQEVTELSTSSFHLCGWLENYSVWSYMGMFASLPNTLKHHDWHLTHSVVLDICNTGHHRTCMTWAWGPPLKETKT